MILPIWIRFVKNDFVYFDFEILSFLALVSTKTENASAHEIMIFEFFVFINYYFDIRVLGLAHRKIWYRLMYILHDFFMLNGNLQFWQRKSAITRKKSSFDLLAGENV